MIKVVDWGNYVGYIRKVDDDVYGLIGKRKAKIVYDSIQKSVKGVSLSKLQHATGMFKGLGSKKLALLEHFTEKPTVNQVVDIEGFAEISAKSYIDSYDEFFDFHLTLNGYAIIEWYPIFLFPLALFWYLLRILLMSGCTILGSFV